MSLLMEPGRALLVMAAVAFLLSLVAGAVPVVGGLLVVILWFAVVFGVAGGMYLTVVARRRPA